MKLKLKILFFPVILLWSTSCKDMLTEDPNTFYSEDAVFSNESGVETAINGVYSQFYSPQYYGTAWHNLLHVLSGMFFSNQAANRDAVGLNTNSSNIWVADLWTQMYSAINTANTVISNLENSEAELSNKESALGQSYFIRGATYLDLVRLFGGVPIRTEPTVIETMHLPRASRADVINLVVADLEKAKIMMPAPGSNRPGRPSRLAANVLLARLYMHLASEQGGDASNWQKALNELLPVYNSGAYSLTPTFAELFRPGNENTKESIFELQYGHTGGIRNSDAIRSFTPSNSTFAPSNVTTFGRIRPNKEIFDQHVAQYPGDPRIAATFVFDSYKLSNGNTQTIYPTRKAGAQGYAVIAKWFDPSYNGTTTERNIIHIRYADVLLMLAEVENEINGPTNAYQYVNKVLARARDTNGDTKPDVTQPADWSGMTKEQFRDRIMKERQYELLSEGQEWFDTHRRGVDYFISRIVTPHNSNKNFDKTTDFVYPTDVSAVRKNLLLPIPLTEISGNQAMSPSDQNPGY
jgi:hypothetical protein